ncbi:uncharacterized protein LOC144103513 [Amblyomma americanum]
MSGAQENDTSESLSKISTSTASSRRSYGGEECAEIATDLLESFGIICRETEQQLSGLNELGSVVPADTADTADSRAVDNTAALNRPARSETRRSIIKFSEEPKDLPSSTKKEGKSHPKKKKSDAEMKKKRWRSVLGPALGSFGLVVFVLVGLVAVFTFAIIFRGGRVAPLANSVKSTTRNDTVSPSG